MGLVMVTLRNIVKGLANLDTQATIYAAEPWTSESKAIVANEPPPGGLPEEAKMCGLKYFIEVAIASDFLEGWASTLGYAPSAEESCDRLIQYAINDA